MENNTVLFFMGNLKERIVSSMLLAVPPEKGQSVSEIIERTFQEFIQRIDGKTFSSEADKHFRSLTGKMLGVLDALGLSDVQRNSVRGMILNEIYSCKDVMLKWKE